MVQDFKEAGQYRWWANNALMWSISSVEHFLHSPHSFHLGRSKAVRSLEGQCHRTQSNLLAGWQHYNWITQHMDMVTLMPRLPLSANSWAMEVSNTRQSEFMMAELTPSWIDLGVASQVRRRL